MSKRKLSEFIAVASTGPEKSSASSGKKSGIAQIFAVENPTHPLETFKNCDATIHGLAVSGSHVFAAQKDKAVVHVYSRQRKNQEMLAVFPERVTCVKFVGEAPNGGVGLLIVGTEAGRIVLWEVATGRQIFSPSSHIQKITCLESSPAGSHVLTGSADASVNVWSVSALLAFPTYASSNAFTQSTESSLIRTLSAHSGPITSLAVGHSSNSFSNIAVSASTDKSILTWNYHTGSILHKVTVPVTATCLALDPVDRGVFVGFENGALCFADYYGAKGARLNVLSRDSGAAQGASVENTAAVEIDIGDDELWEPKGDEDLGAVRALVVGYDGSQIISGHESGVIARWNVGAKAREEAFDSVLLRMDYPVAAVESLPIKGIWKGEGKGEPRLKLSHVVKPRAQGSGEVGDDKGVPINYTVTAQLSPWVDDEDGAAGGGWFRNALTHSSFPADLMPDFIGGEETDGDEIADGGKLEGNGVSNGARKEEIEALKLQLAESKAREAATQEQVGKLSVENAMLKQQEAAQKRKKRRTETEPERAS